MTFTEPAPVPGNAPEESATVTSTASAASTAPNQTTLAPAASFTPAMPPPARPCGRTVDAAKCSSIADEVTNASCAVGEEGWAAPTTSSPSFSVMISKESLFG